MITDGRNTHQTTSGPDIVCYLTTLIVLCLSINPFPVLSRELNLICDSIFTRLTEYKQKVAILGNVCQLILLPQYLYIFYMKTNKLLKEFESNVILDINNPQLETCKFKVKISWRVSPWSSFTIPYRQPQVCSCLLYTSRCV